MRLLDGFQELVFPPRCLGCGVLRQGICNSCSKELQLHDYRSHVGKIPVFSSIRYSARAARILLAAKEDGVRKADEVLVAALRHSTRIAMQTFDIRPELIPIPHGRRAIRIRGRNFLGEITKILGSSESLPVRPIIQHNRRVVDQSLLDASSRFGNLSGAMSVTDSCGRPCEVFLVDDLVTTGATLSEAVSTLEKAGFRVVAAVTALVALPLR